MHLTPLSVELLSLDLAAVFDFDIIYRQFQTLADTRKRRGVRYPLAVLLTIAVLAKLAGSRGARAIADWATLRAEVLAELFDLPRPRMPHLTTWTRVLGHAVVLEAFEQVVAQISARPYCRGTCSRQPPGLFGRQNASRHDSARPHQRRPFTGRLSR